MSIAIGIDLGGTRIKGVAVNDQGDVLYQIYADTNDGDNAVWKKAVAETVQSLLEKIKQHSAVIGISAPGLPDDDNSYIAVMPGRMQGLEKLVWKEFLGHPSYVMNDGIAAMMAEAQFGAAKTKKHAVLLTLGTGVGGAILIDGKPYQGAFNKAGHVGHMVIRDEGDCDVTGMPGSLEECIGNCTVEKRSQGKFSSTKDLLDAFRNGDEFAREIWLKSVQHLAIGIASITNILSPEIIVLGGGITEAGRDLFEPLEKFIEQFLQEWNIALHDEERLIFR